MPYDIELMCIGCDFYALLKAAAVRLNGVQEEFRFRPTSQTQRAAGTLFTRDEYLSTEIWAFLKDQRTATGGNRPYIIGFVRSPFRSEGMRNLFGSSQAENGLAAVTLHSCTQYVKEEKRYCCYYMVRYAMGFVNPTVRSHDDKENPERTKCYFHKKIYKPDIRASMDSGYICDQCWKHFDNPTQDGVSKRLSTDEREALRKMREVVSNDFPHAIVMKGGGVKGLAFAGALAELENYFWFDRHVGTSAGAIASVLLAADYSPKDLVRILRAKNFREFMDARIWQLPFNLLFKTGLFPGEHFRLWIAQLLGAKTGKISETKMSDLNGALVYASRRGPGTLVFDSQGERKDAVAAFATRCSMSIPIFFFPQQVDGRRVFDGGLRNNFPLSRFMADHPGKPFVALYLGKRDDRNQTRLGLDFLDIVVDGEERDVVDSNRESVVVIDTSPVGTIDFEMTELEKDLLLTLGKAAALRFLLNRKFDEGPEEATVLAAEQEAERIRSEVCNARKRRRRKRILIGLLVAGVLAFLVLVR